MRFKTIQLPTIMSDLDLGLLSDVDPIVMPYWNAYWALPDDVLREHSYVWGSWGARTYSSAELIVADEQMLALLNTHWIIMMPDVLKPAAYALFFEDEIILFHVSVAGVLEYKDNNNVSESDQVVGVLVIPFILPEQLQSRRQEIETVMFEIFKYKFTQWGDLRMDKTVAFSIRFGKSYRMLDYSYSHEICMPINNQ